MISLFLALALLSTVSYGQQQLTDEESNLRRRPIRHALPPPIDPPIIFPGTFKTRASPTILREKEGTDRFLKVPSQIPKEHHLWPRPENQPEVSSVPEQMNDQQMDDQQMNGMYSQGMSSDPLMNDPLFASMMGSMMSGSEGMRMSSGSEGMMMSSGSEGMMIPGMIGGGNLMNNPLIMNGGRFDMMNNPMMNGGGGGMMNNPMMNGGGGGGGGFPSRVPRFDVSSPVASTGFHTPETIRHFYNMSGMMMPGNASSQNLGMPMMINPYMMGMMNNPVGMNMMNNPVGMNMMMNPMSFGAGGAMTKYPGVSIMNPNSGMSGTGQLGKMKSGFAPLTLANGMTMNVPKDYAHLMRFRKQQPQEQQQKVENKNNNNLADQMRFRASRASLQSQTSAKRARVSSQASAKMSAIMQHSALLKQQLAGAEAATGNVQSAMANMQGSLMQQQQQMMMMQQQALAHKQYVEMLQRRMVALDLVRQRVMAGMELDRLLKQYEYMQMFDRALDMRKLAQAGMEEAIVRKAATASEYMKETTARIEEVMNPLSVPRNATKPKVPPETATLDLLSKASSLEQQAQKAEQDAHAAFYDLLSGKPSKPKAGGEAGKAGGEAAKKK